MAGCDNCVYSKYIKMRPRVAREAALVFVGEAPTSADIARMDTFNGAGGNLLKTTMQKVGLPTEDVFMTYALGCIPPKGKPIKKEAIANCRVRLLEELKIANPKLIITFGSTALQSVTKDSSLKVTQEQGTIVECPELVNTKVIPVVSPTAILRAPGSYKGFQQVLTYASQVFNSDTLMDPGETTYLLIRNEIEVKLAIDLLQGVEYLAADIESVSLDRNGTDIKDILVMGVAYAKNKVLVFTPPSYPYLQPLFDLPKQWIWHYGYGYDAMYCRSRGLNVPFKHDTMLLHYCLNETSGTHSLEPLAIQYLGAKSYKSEANKYITSEGGFGSAPLQVQAKRVAMDADYTLQLFWKFKQEIDTSPELSKLYDKLLLPASQLLIQMMKKGMLIDVDQMHKLHEKYTKMIAGQIEHIQEEIGDAWDRDLYMVQAEAKSAPEQFNPASPKQLAWLVFDRFKIKVPRRKKRSTDSEVLLSLGKSSDPLVALANLREAYPWLASILDLRSTKKELSTYVEGMLDRMDSNNRVHSSFTLHVTSTGRLSSTSPNLQNIPSIKKDVRKGFIAPQGHILLECDYKGAELRVLAHVSGVGELGRALIEGRDLHDELSKRFWGPGFTKAQRMQAKTINFGVMYGREAYSVAVELGIDIKDAQGLINEWFLMYPEAKEYLDSCVADVKAGRALWTPLGRCRRFGLITPDTVDHINNEARNYRIQSISSDLTLISAIKLQPQLAKYGAEIINLVHDSILVECPKDPDIVRPVAALIEKEMMATPKEVLNSMVPFDIDIEIGRSWGEIFGIGTYPEYKDYKEVVEL